MRRLKFNKSLSKYIIYSILVITVTSINFYKGFSNISYAQGKSNCVYQTSNGVCFTTKMFSPYALNSDNYWLGAKDECESKGYRLPNDYELRALFSDIIGITIKSGTNIKSSKSSNTNIPTNYEIIKKISQNGNYNTNIHKDIYLWENQQFSEKQAYVRNRTTFWGIEESKQAITDKNYSFICAICVYNPNGKTHKSLKEFEREKYKQDVIKRNEEIKQIREDFKIRDKKNAEETLL